MKLKISAPCVVLDTRTQDAVVSDSNHLAALDGLIYEDECFSDYLCDDPTTKQLPNRGVSGGYLSFRFDAADGELWAETAYDLREPLSETEVTSLRDYTLGQWSDGIGENFCPEYREKTGFFICIQWNEAKTS